MEIEAYRTRFRGKNSFGVPFGDLIPVINEKDEPDSFATDGVTTFSVTTHDRGDIKQPTKEFYQIVFRIVGNDRKKQDLQLILDKDHENPLYYDSESDLWYQRTWFSANERPDPSSNKVDSISTAGVYFISLIDI